MQPSSSQIKKHFAWSRRMKPFSKEICDQTKDKELIVYGTGAVGEVVTQALLNWGRMPNLYCDHDPEKKVFFNRTVISPD